MSNIQYQCTMYTFTVQILWECPISNIDVQGRHSLYYGNVQYQCTRYTFTVQTYVNVQYPISMYNVYIHCTNPMGMSNIQYRCTRQTFTVQTYANDQYPISMYKVDIHCTNLLECPISNINVQGRHSLYKPMRMTNMQHRYTRQKFPVNGQYPISKTHHRYSLYNQYVQYPISIIYLYCRLYFLFYFSN